MKRKKILIEPLSPELYQDLHPSDYGIVTKIAHSDYMSMEDDTYGEEVYGCFEKFELWVYDHSVQAFMLERRDRWDSYQIGWIYAKDRESAERSCRLLTDLWNGWMYEVSVVTEYVCDCCGSVTGEDTEPFSTEFGSLFATDSDEEVYGLFEGNEELIKDEDGKFVEIERRDY